jgi:hypothetical protein
MICPPENEIKFSLPDIYNCQNRIRTDIYEMGVTYLRPLHQKSLETNLLMNFLNCPMKVNYELLKLLYNFIISPPNTLVKDNYLNSQGLKPDNAPGAPVGT